MTPKEKAFELVDRFMEHTVEWDKIKEVAYDSEYHAKKCALIAVGEMLEILYESPAKNVKELAFCIDVSNEIKKL
jgi:hypothetical protein